MYAFLFLVLFALAFFIVRLTFPLYFFDVIIVNMSMSWLSNAHMFNQLSTLFFYFYPILFLVILLLMIGRHENMFGQPSGMDHKSSLNISECQLPLIQYNFDYYLYFFICSLLAFMLLLGRHLGNNMNYAYQLLVPTFFCWFFQKYSFKNGLKLFASLIILFNLFSWQGKLLAPSMLEQKDSREWARFYLYIRSSSNILNSQIETSEVLQLGQMPVDGGQTIVYYEVKPFSDNLWMDASYETVVANGFRYVRSIDQSVEKQKFDVAVLVKEKGTFFHVKRLGDTYSLFDEIVLDMPQTNQRWTVLIWKPKPK